MRALLTVAALVALATPVLACINDTELINHEREFRSQYQESQYEPPQPEAVSSSRPFILGGAGVLMALAAAGVMVRLRSQPR